MPKVTYIQHDGTSHVLELPEGGSVMQGAVDSRIPGIDADCGGQCACATCHVFVDEAWLAMLPPMNEQEASMLGFAAETLPNSRLSCQIPVTAALDGLVVRLPEAQH
jgi:2Fe-2S ferredoxin